MVRQLSSTTQAGELSKICSLRTCLNWSMLIAPRTTGLPKGVQLSHYNIVANSTQLLFKRALAADTTKGRARKERLDISGERWLAPLPMYHAYVRLTILPPWSREANSLVRAKFTIPSMLLFLEQKFTSCPNSMRRHICCTWIPIESHS